MCSFKHNDVLQSQPLGESSKAGKFPLYFEHDTPSGEMDKNVGGWLGFGEAEGAPCCIQESNLILMARLVLDLPKCSVLLQIPEGTDTRRCEQLRAGEGLP